MIQVNIVTKSNHLKLKIFYVQVRYIISKVSIYNKDC
jgi:hypothetical protein